MKKDLDGQKKLDGKMIDDNSIQTKKGFTKMYRNLEK